MKCVRIAAWGMSIPVIAIVLANGTVAAQLRPPSIPLVACDPYFSIWSSADQLTDADTVHWTGKPHRLSSSIRIDGYLYRVMGAHPEDMPPLPQKSVRVLPTRTIYTFEGAGVQLTFVFLTPALPDDLEVLSRPVTYLTWDVKSVDGITHDVQLECSASGELAVNTPNEQVTAEVQEQGDLVTHQGRIN